MILRSFLAVFLFAMIPPANADTLRIPQTCQSIENVKVFPPSAHLGPLVVVICVDKDMKAIPFTANVPQGMREANRPVQIQVVVDDVPVPTWVKEGTSI